MLVKTERYRNIIEANTIGSFNRRGAFPQHEFARIKVQLPSRPVQRRIAGVVETCDREIELFLNHLDTLQELKRSLMHILPTGQVQVKVKEEK
ncbi:MAG TPA: hypothetical protein VFT34_16485 [Verrucomicrobiae bacterium]|nr:hypothetical protein [Verrucomicrobiae bacterium]